MTLTLPIAPTGRNYQWEATLDKSEFQSQLDGRELWTFKPDFSQGLQGSAVDGLLDELFPNLHNRAKTSRRQALSSALLALAQAVNFDQPELLHGFLHSRSTQRRKQVARYKVCSFKGPLFTEALDALSGCGFVFYKGGFNSKDEGRSGLVTLWLPDPSFMEWLKVNSGGLELIAHMEQREVIQCKNKDKKLIEYEDTTAVKAMRKRVEQGNLLRERFRWEYAPMSDDRQFMLDDVRHVIPAASLRCHRSFNEDFDTGGRFYCDAQRLRNAERSTIMIDGQPTIEIDFKSLHPRLMYNSEGHEAPVDCYASDQRSRKLTKKVSLFSINCRSFAQARKTLMREAGISSEEATRHLKAYAEEHQVIAHRFFESGWGRLQNLDSQLVDAVLVEAMTKGIPVLPVHDSFIVTTRWADWLRKQVEESYRSLMGFDAVVDWGPMPDIDLTATF